MRKPLHNLEPSKLLEGYHFSFMNMVMEIVTKYPQKGYKGAENKINILVGFSVIMLMYTLLLKSCLQYPKPVNPSTY